MLSLILRRIFINGPKKIVVELLRPFFSINSNFIKKISVLGTVLKKLLKILTSLRTCSDLYAHAEHMTQELMHALNVRVRS
jgi:hypothetical protein